jgi:gluconate 2-dehydrogenase gamma chain
VIIIHQLSSIETLLLTDLVTEPTRQALTKRLNTLARQPTFFSTDEFALLQAICARLMPQDERPEADRIDIAGGIDRRLAANKTNGWRYDDMPPDADAYRLGLQGVDETSQTIFDQPFRQLSGEQQDTVLTAVQSANAPGETWQTLPAARFFEELMAEVAEVYYSHPLAQQEIGYVGMTDAPGWQRIGLNELEDREKLMMDDG